MGILENAKEIASLVRDVGNMDLYRKILDLQGEIIELTQHNRTLEQQVAELKRQRIAIDELRFDAPFYLGQTDEDLFCARCVESDQRAVHLVKTVRVEMARRVWACPQCKRDFPDMRRPREG